MKVMKKALVAGGLFLSLGSISQAKITLETHGMLGVSYQHVSSSAVSVMSAVSADLGLTENWFAGVGAIGMWRIWGSNGWNMSSGDVSSTYLAFHSSNKKLKMALGRYTLERGPTALRTTDFIRGSVQGFSLQFSGVHTDLKALNYWFSYINSTLNDGSMPGRIGSIMVGNSDYLTNKYKIGGEILLAGLDYKYKGIYISPWLLFNTRSPWANGMIMQVGAKALYNVSMGGGWRSITSGNAIFQYDTSNPSPIGGFVNVDQEFRYSRLTCCTARGNKYELWHASVGLGGLGSMVTNSRAIFQLKDSFRFYGYYVNGSNYFTGGNATGYIFGNYENRLFRVDALAAFGNYDEYSLVGAYKIYRQSRNSDEGSVLGVDIGAGYVYSSAVASVTANGFFAFVKLHF